MRVIIELADGRYIVLTESDLMLGLAFGAVFNVLAMLVRRAWFG